MARTNVEPDVEPEPEGSLEDFDAWKAANPKAQAANAARASETSAG